MNRVTKHCKRIQYLLLIALMYCIATLTMAHAEDWYIAKDGKDYWLGTYNQPFKSMSKAMQFARDSDTIYIMDGTYTATELGTAWHFRGDSSSSRVTVRPYSTGNWPVVITGYLNLYGWYGAVEDIKFFRNGIDPYSSGIGLINIHGHTISVQNCLIQGNPGDQYSSNPSFDGIKIVSKMNKVATAWNHSVEIGNNEIIYISEHPIDITGARDCYFHDNKIHNNRLYVSVKGGTLRLLIERNKIWNQQSGICSGSMDCNTIYCGSPYLPTIELADRYVGKRITVRNNLFYNLSGYSMKVCWLDSYIYNNTFVSENAEPILYFKQASLRFFDDYATGVHYFKSQNVQFKNNILYGMRGRSIKGETVKDLDNFNGAHNLYQQYNSGTPNFSAGSSVYYGVESWRDSSLGREDDASVDWENLIPGFRDAELDDYSLLENAYVIDEGLILSGVLDDIKSANRIDYPDLGCYESGSTR